MRAIQLSSGDVFGRLTVIGLGERGKKRKWLCRCACGTESMVVTSRLTSGETISCGCFAKERRAEANTKHGHAQYKKKTAAYQIWEQMLARCHRPTNRAFPDYGGRGIKVCDSWRSSFSAFLRDMGEPEAGQSIERDDVDGDYEPKNCRWATRLEQNNNTRANVMLATHEDVLTVAEFARRYSLNYGTLRSRIRRGETDMAGIKFQVLGKRSSIHTEAD